MAETVRKMSRLHGNNSTTHGQEFTGVTTMTNQNKFRIIIETPPVDDFGFVECKASPYMFLTNHGAEAYAREKVRGRETWIIVEVVGSVSVDDLTRENAHPDREPEFGNI